MVFLKDCVGDRVKYTIIIPVYNAEKTLGHCVDSIIRQDFSDYEIVLVDDGSKDNSAEICRELESKYQNVKYVSKKNGGASSARNAGLDIAKGDFILFVDSDDYVEDNYFDIIDANTCMNGLSVFTYTWIKPQSNQKRQINDNLSNAPFFEKVRYLILSRTINSPCAKVFDKRIIDKINLRFDERMPVAEDFNFCLKYVMSCDDVIIKNESVYFYDVRNENSLVRGKKEGLIDIYPVVFDVAYTTIANSSFSSEEKNQLFRIWDKLHVDSFGTCVMEELKETNRPARETKKIIKILCKKFYADYPGGFGYQNIIHFIMRICIKNNWSTALYYLGKQYVKMRS